MANVDWFARLEEDGVELTNRFKNSLIRVNGQTLSVVAIRRGAGDQWHVLGQRGALPVPVNEVVTKADIDFSWPTPKVVDCGQKSVGYLAPVAGHKAIRGFYFGSMMLTTQLHRYVGGRAAKFALDYDALRVTAYYNAHTPAPAHSARRAWELVCDEGHISVALNGSIWMAQGHNKKALVYLRNALVGTYDGEQATLPVVLNELREQFGDVFPQINWTGV